MKEAGERLLDKAARAIASAQRELASGDAEFAVARAYAKTGEMNPQYHRWLLAAFEKRVTADYGVEDVIESHDAEETITQAREFLEAARRYLEIRST